MLRLPSHASGTPQQSRRWSYAAQSAPENWCRATDTPNSQVRSFASNVAGTRPDTGSPCLLPPLEIAYGIESTGWFFCRSRDAGSARYLFRPGSDKSRFPDPRLGSKMRMCRVSSDHRVATANWRTGCDKQTGHQPIRFCYGAAIFWMDPFPVCGWCVGAV